MATAAHSSWPDILTQLTANLDAAGGKTIGDIVSFSPFPRYDTSIPMATHGHARTLTAELDQIDVTRSEEEPALGASVQVEGVDDWMATLDIINGMVGLAEEQKRCRTEQSVSHQAELDGLRRDLGSVQERLRAAEMRARETKARADIHIQRAQAEANAQVQEIRAESEARVRTIRAELETQLRAAEEQMQIANLRAATAEQWLLRIDAAAKELLLGGHMNTTRLGT